jgi:monovalent cation:H+ antiporter, CPA1 family
MKLFNIITILIVLSALFGYINVRFLKLPSTIGLMIIALGFTTLLIGLSFIDPTFLELEIQLVQSIDFRTVVLDIMLSFLLFAGALHTDLATLKALRRPILMFATLGILLSTALIASLFYGLTALFGIEVDFIHCLLFGALISPTDPIAVLGILKQAKVPKILEVKITGESLFNDGIGVVVFLTLFSIAQQGIENVSAGSVAFLFLEEVGGGILLGLILGYSTYWLTRSINDYETEVIITLASVMGGYLLASTLHFSGPLAIVVTGLFVGNYERERAMSDTTILYVDKFWELIDVLLNAVLFLLIGMEIVILPWEPIFIGIGAVTIVVVLLCRYVSLAGPVRLFREKLDFVPGTTLIMTWGGLRGGISIALALALLPEMNRELILTVTYVVVVFSIIVQGLSVGKLVKIMN